MPRVSVIMSTYNNDIYLQASIESILYQTYGDFEFIIIDDGSTDCTTQMLPMVKDPRVRIIRHDTPWGLIGSLNHALSLVQGEYVARMDADDTSSLDRLMIQVGYMDANPQVEICGTGIILSLQENPKIYPATHDEIQTWLLFHCCLAHPTVMFRRTAIDRLQIRYDPSYPHAEDYELWNRLAPHARMANIPMPLLYYRQHQGQVSKKFKKIQDNSARRVHERQLSFIGIFPTEEEYNTHLDFINFHIDANDYESYSRALRWAEKLLHHNSMYPYYNQEMLNVALSRCISHIPY